MNIHARTITRAPDSATDLKTTRFDAASAPRPQEAMRTLVVSGNAPKVARLAQLASLLPKRSLVVVNDARTIPASFRTKTGDELRLLRNLSAGAGDTMWQVIALGHGDHRTPTERRRPPTYEAGELIELEGGVKAEVTTVDAKHPRLITLRSSTSLLAHVQNFGRPVCYAYHDAGLAGSAFQTPYARRALALEMPSAGRGLSADIIASLWSAGHEVVSLTHAASLSSTGDAGLDAALPLPERYAIPSATAEAVNSARRLGRTIIAIGTTVTRALEGCFQTNGQIIAGEAETDLKLSPEFGLRVVSGILSNLHEPGESHFELLRAFASRQSLSEALSLAELNGLLAHEFGDTMLVLPG